MVEYQRDAAARRFLWLGVWVEGGLLVVGCVLGMWMTDSPFGYMTAGFRIVLIGVAFSLPLTMLFFVLWHLPGHGLRSVRSLVEQTLGPMTRHSPACDLALVSVLAGLGEEFLFRGVLQLWLGSVISPVAGLVLASIGFGLAHAVSRTYFVLATLIGAYLGWLFMATDSLLPPIMAHAIYDFAGLLYIRHQARRPRP